jgi:5-methylcytosine-specific restriction protein A
MGTVNDTRISDATSELLAALESASACSASESDMVAALRDYGIARDRLDAAGVQLIAAMTRRGVFAAHGYHRPEYAVADLLGWDRRPARRRVALAEQVCERVGLDGQLLAAPLPATSVAFATGEIGVAHAEVIAALLNGPAARQLDPDTWAAAEEQIAHYAASTKATPNDVAGWARQLIEALDQDGEQPREEPEQVNELHLTRNPCGTGGRVRGELDGPTFEALDTAIGALSKPLPDVPRTLPQRQADALGEICEHTLRHHGSLPDTGGERPQIRVTIDWERLRAAVAGAHLDTGAWYSPSQLRLLACDCAVVPAVLASSGEPLDIGRATRTIPAGIRRAVAIRDRGCAYPGCNRPPIHCDVHHCHEWADGGDTALHNCVMLCRAHHSIIHNTEWSVRIREGHPEFRPPAFLEREIRRRPRITA